MLFYQNLLEQHPKFLCLLWLCRMSILTHSEHWVNVHWCCDRSWQPHFLLTVLEAGWCTFQLLLHKRHSPSLVICNSHLFFRTCLRGGKELASYVVGGSPCEGEVQKCVCISPFPWASMLNRVGSFRKMPRRSRRPSQTHTSQACWSKQVTSWAKWHSANVYSISSGKKCCVPWKLPFWQW